MNREIITSEYFVQPGYICLPHSATLLYTVTGSGIAVTLYDTKQKKGGMSHFTRAKRVHKHISTPMYAYPSISGLINMLLNSGSKLEDLEAHIFGGAENPEAHNYIVNLANENIEAAFKILSKKNICIAGMNIGSRRGRKVMFNTFSGETIVSSVNSIRESDWYPRV